MPKPKPITVDLCVLCGQSWAKHLALATSYLDPDGKVKVKHCIQLLKEVNRGPMGPTGPAGISGPTGPKGPMWPA